MTELQKLDLKMLVKAMHHLCEKYVPIDPVRTRYIEFLRGKYKDNPPDRENDDQATKPR